MGQSYCSLFYHIVYSTKYRQHWLKPPFAEEMHRYLGGVIHDLGGTPIIINGHVDHVHLLVSLHQQRGIAEILRTLKARSSGWVHRTRPELSEFRWQRGYGIFTVGHREREHVRRYILRQEEHHRAEPFETEFIRLLDENDVPYDRNTVFD